MSSLPWGIRNMLTQSAMLSRAIRAIGDPEFASVAAQCALDCARFDLALIIVHHRTSPPSLLFDNFAAAGGREGIENYVSVTHSVNPILKLATKGVGVFRARDFAARALHIDASTQPLVVRAPTEELGFRTRGWPEGLEEIALYFSACRGLVELSLYRERRHSAARPETLKKLRALGVPLAAAFDRHARLAQSVNIGATSATARLSPREAQITDLLLRGCGSEAIALRLSISRHTVKDHRKQIFRKLGVGTLAQLFALHWQQREASVTIAPSREG